jgi:hypothetical protein
MAAMAKRLAARKEAAAAAKLEKEGSEKDALGEL